jgi:hypothetical protein
MAHITKIQAWFRGCSMRNKRLPTMLYSIQRTLLNADVEIASSSADGRINSVFDEQAVIELLKDKYAGRISVPNIRAWYDIKVYDYLYGWIPVNIKSTRTTTSDNIGNLAICVHAYTNSIIPKFGANNGKMSTILCEKLRKKFYNKKRKKDYYFVVINKNDHTDIIINSLKGLTVLTPNVNNLPFQICWNKNRTFVYQPIAVVIEKFIECVQKPNPSWKELFMANMRALH